MYLYIISDEFLSTHGLVYSGLTSKYLVQYNNATESNCMVDEHDDVELD